MINLKCDITIIGGGIAGLTAGISAKKSGAKKVIIIDRNDWIGGILPQCIHDGFGIEETKISMTGPEYIQRYIQEAKKLDIDFFIKTMVLSINNKLEIISVSEKGLFKINSKSIILAMGCREKTRGNLMIPGDRPSGIYTAGLAQTLINLYNIMPGKNILILGSGDVGLIMARRLKLEGANVLGVVEILSYPTGLPRNVVQCLKDYEIPLYFNYTIKSIGGKNRLEKIIISNVNQYGEIIRDKDLAFNCDTLLLSVGLIPENELSREAGIKIDNLTKGPIVNQNFETTLSGIFACGNCLQVYDTVDLLSIHAKIAGKYSAIYAMEINNNSRKNNIIVEPKNGIKYVIPQRINKSGLIEFSIKVKKPSELIKIYFKINDKMIHSKKIKYVNPANIINLNVEIPETTKNSINVLEVGIFE
jgi:NADPH-dependent 2,4-dienoyl-CoA reductase/sulfur reductase-like enzyme